MLAGLEMMSDWLQNTFRTMIRQRGGPTAIGQLCAVFDVVESIIKSDEFQGCIFVNAAMEFPLPHEPIHVVASQHKLSIEDTVHVLAVKAGASEPRRLAQELCLIMEVAYVTRLVTGNRQTIDIAHRIADSVISSHCPDPSAQALTAGSDGDLRLPQPAV